MIKISHILDLLLWNPLIFVILGSELFDLSIKIVFVAATWPQEHYRVKKLLRGNK